MKKHWGHKMKLTKSKLKKIIKEELQQLNEMETYQLNQQLVDKLPDIFRHQLKRLGGSSEYMAKQDSKGFTKILQNTLKVIKQLAVKFGNDVKKVK